MPVFTLAHFGHHVVGALLRPMLPKIMRDFGLDYAGAGWVQSAYALTGGFSQVPAGWLADRIGPRLIVAVSVAGVAMAGVLIGLSPNLGWLVVFLIMAAVMEGGYHPASASAISSVTPPENRGRALGTHLVGGSSSFWIVPLVAAPIAESLGWRGAYITLTIPAIVLGIALYFMLRRRADTRSVEQRIADGEAMEPPVPVRWGRILPFIILTVATGTAVQSVSGFLSPYAVDHFNVSDVTAARLTAVSPAMGLIAAPLGGYLSDRLGRVRVTLAMSFLAVPAIYLFGAAPNLATLIAVMVLMGGISFIRMPASEAYIIGEIPERRRATVLGMYYFASREVGGLLAPVVGKLIDTFRSINESLAFYRAFGTVSLALAAVVVTCSLFLWKNRE